MKNRNFLAELLLQPAQQVPTPVLRPQQPVAVSQQQQFTPTSVLDRRDQLANILLEQAQDRTAHPIARGLAAYLGTKQSQEINRERVKTEEALRTVALEREARKERIAQERFDADLALKQRGVELEEKTIEQAAKQFDETLKLNRDKFNAEVVRDKQKNAFTKVPSADGQVDLLFKGVAPVTDGLEKGLQWGVDKEGNRIAVPITTQPNEKAQQTKDLTLSVVDRLLKNETGVRDNFGPYDAITPNIQDATREAATDLDQLRALLTVENLGLMSGVLSETDIKILQNVAGGGLAQGNSEEGALRAIKDIQKSLSGKPKEAPKSGPIDYREFFK